VTLDGRHGQHARGVRQSERRGRVGGPRRDLLTLDGRRVGVTGGGRRRRGGALRLRLRRRERGTCLLGQSNDGRTGEFETIDAESSIERLGIGPDEAVVIPVHPISTGGTGRDRGPSIPSRRGGRRVDGGFGGLDEPEPGRQPRPEAPSSRAATLSTMRHQGQGGPTAFSTGLEGVLDHDEPISIGHDPPDIVASGTDLDKRDALGVAWHGGPNLCKQEKEWKRPGAASLSGPRPLNRVGRSFCSEDVRSDLQILFGRCYPDRARSAQGPRIAPERVGGTWPGRGGCWRKGGVIGGKSSHRLAGGLERGGGCALHRASWLQRRSVRRGFPNLG
jgi:hypothetical protein